jgi:hypothetical protein
MSKVKLRNQKVNKSELGEIDESNRSELLTDTFVYGLNKEATQLSILMSLQTQDLKMESGVFVNDTMQKLVSNYF